MDLVFADPCLKEILNSGLKAVLPENFLRKAVGAIEISKNNESFHLFGAGKAALSMAEAMMDLKHSQILSATIISNEMRRVRFSRIEAFYGTHPLLSQENIDASKEIIWRMRALRESDSFLFLLSGGASALFEILNPKISLAIYRDMVNRLMREGIDILELNSIRIILSLLKGGRAARQVKASGALLLVSDVLTDAPELIASGPFYYTNKQHLNKARATDLYQRWRLERWIPWALFLEMVSGLPVFNKKERRIPHRIVANNKLALKAAAQKASQLGWQTKIYPRMLYGEAKEMARIISHQITEIEKSAEGTGKFCLIWGGETTVTVCGDGIGGRNQELLLSLTAILADRFSWRAAAIGSDGIDGVSKAAGAWFSSQDFSKIKASGYEIDDYLRRNDSASFFKKYQRQIITGSTGTNVGDLLIVLLGNL